MGSVIMDDPSGAQFPWAPKPLEELLGDVVLDGAGKEIQRTEALKDKYVMLYFSAHWCPPCKRFTPELAKTYAAIKAQRSDMELVFVSGDRSKEAFNEYKALSSHFEVSGIPTLVVLSP